MPSAMTTIVIVIVIRAVVIVAIIVRARIVIISWIVVISGIVIAIVIRAVIPRPSKRDAKTLCLRVALAYRHQFQYRQCLDKKSSHCCTFFFNIAFIGRNGWTRVAILFAQFWRRVALPLWH